MRGAAGAGRGGVEKAAGGKVESVGKATVGIRAVEEDVEAIYLERTGRESYLVRCLVRRVEDVPA